MNKMYDNSNKGTNESIIWMPTEKKKEKPNWNYAKENGLARISRHEQNNKQEGQNHQQQQQQKTQTKEMHFGKVAVRTRRRMAGFRAFVWLSWWLLCMSCMAHKLVRMWALNVLILFQSYETLKCRVNIEKWTQINALQIIRRQSGFVFFFRRCSIPTLVFLFLFSSVSPVVPVRSRLCGTLFHNPSRWMAFYQFMLLLFSNAFLLCFCFFFLSVRQMVFHWCRFGLALKTDQNCTDDDGFSS